MVIGIALVVVASIFAIAYNISKMIYNTGIVDKVVDGSANLAKNAANELDVSDDTKNKINTSVDNVADAYKFSVRLRYTLTERIMGWLDVNATKAEEVSSVEPSSS